MADFPFFKMAAVRHLGFVKVGNFNFRSGPEAQYASSHHAKFREDRSNRSGDMDDFRFFKMAAVRGVIWIVCKFLYFARYA